MIKSFRHAELERFYRTGSRAGIQPAHADKLSLQLFALDHAKSASDLARPGWKLHLLKGDLAGHRSIKVNGNWRVTFSFEGEDVILTDYQDYHGEVTMAAMSEMYNPPHPGKVLREYMADMDITSMAQHLHISRVTLSRILNGSAGISAEMSLRLGDALGTHPSFWYDMQASFDMWQAKQKKRRVLAVLKVA